MDFYNDMLDLEKNLLKEEGIEYKDLELIDLNIAYSPVIPIRNGSAVDVTKLTNGKYRLENFYNFGGTDISEEELKIMRLRYLLKR